MCREEVSARLNNGRGCPYSNETPENGTKRPSFGPQLDPEDAGAAHSRVRRERLFCLGSGHHHGHLTVVFSRRPHGYFNVLAESGEEVNEATYREVARAIARQRRDMGLRNAEDFPSFGLGDASFLDDAVDL